MDFPNIFVINLDDRTERWEEIQQSFADWPPLERVSAVKDSPGWKGCAKSHIKCIRLSKERGYPWVLILEDDCLVKPDSLDRFRELLPVLWERRSEWDIFLGGSTSVKNIKLMETKPPIFSISGPTTHFCLINMEAYDKVLNGYDLTKEIDVFYEESIRLWCTAPFIAVQRPGKSDIENKNVSYSEQFAHSEQKLMENLSTHRVEEGFKHGGITIFNDNVLALNFAIVVAVIIGIIICMGKRYR